MNGRSPIEEAGWGHPASREGFSERDPALAGGDRRGERRLPLGALAIAAIGLVAGVIGSIATPGSARFDLTVAEGLARSGFAVAILAGIWISLGGRERAPGARKVGIAIVVVALLATLATA